MSQSIIHTQGIVLKAFAYGETSLIVEIFTKQLGMRSYIVNGVRSKKSFGKVHMYHPLHQLQLHIYDKEIDKLNRIKEANYDKIYTRINVDVITSTVGSLIGEFCSKSIKEKEPNELLYDFLSSSLDQLDSGQTYLPIFHIIFLIQLTEYLGFYPMNNYHKELRPIFDLQEGVYVSGHHHGRNQMSRDASYDWYLILDAIHNGEAINVSRKGREVILDNLVKYYQLHVANFQEVKSLEVLRAILN